MFDFHEINSGVARLGK